ncbi:MAG: hypothetical protein EOM80_07995 [Erysipelotrichia bacterium]|nr:hypothetical protein [Erysipelotrichia bacterium]
MKKHTLAILVASLFALFTGYSVIAAETTATATISAVNNIVVAGEPPITEYAVDCHIRILEFVLGTRMTVKQKNDFLAAIKKECAEMTTEEKNGFLEAVELVDTMAEMDAKQLETVQKVLAKDFQESATDTEDDPAAQLYLQLQNESFKTIIGQENSGITRQSFDAFAEYLAFAAQPDNPVWFASDNLEKLEVFIKTNFASLTDDEKAALEDFQLTWHMIRAAWQGTSDTKKKTAWNKSLAACGLKTAELPELNKLKAALSTDVYADLLDEATKLGVAPLEWSASTTFRIW